MFALQRTLTLGYLTQRWTRTLLIVLSIALGVATLVATRALSQSLGQAAESAINSYTTDLDLLVENGQKGVPGSLTARLEGLPELERVEPMVLGNVALRKRVNKDDELNKPDPVLSRQVLLVGLDRSSFKPQDAKKTGQALIQDIELHGMLQGSWSSAEVEERIQAFRAQGKMAADLGDNHPLLKRLCCGHQEGQDVVVFLGKDLAAKVGKSVQPGESFVLNTGVVAHWVGTITLTTDEQKKVGSNTLFMAIDDAARILMPKRPSYVSRIGLRLRSDGDRTTALAHLREVVGNDGYVRTIEDSNKSVRDITNGLELGFQLGGAGALVVGLFLVYNALSVSVAERRHDIGMMRSLGATRGQVVRMFLFEGLALGVIGSLLGLPVGYGLTWAALGPVRSLLEEMFNVTLNTNGVPIERWTVMLALVTGPLTAVLAALVPALQASEENPADAVRRSPRLVGSIYRILHLSVVGAVLATGLVLILARRELPARVGAFGGVVCILIGSLAATPLLTSALARFLLPLSRLLFGIEGRLAADNLVRAPGRTGLVIAALAATSALLVQTAGFIQSTESTLVGWIDEKIGADLFILSGHSLTTAGLPMDPKVGDDLRKDPRVRAVLPVRAHQSHFRNSDIIVLAVDVAAMQNAPKDLSIARSFGRFPELTTPGTCLMSENFAALHNVSVGDTVSVDRDGIEMRVLGTVVDYTWNRGTLIVDRAWFASVVQDDQVDIFDVWLQPGADANAVARDMRAQPWVSEQLLVVSTRAEGRSLIVSAINRLYGLLYVQQGIVGLVALLGVVSALFISVLQRRRELGLLRAVGATRLQVLRSVLAEATLMGTFGALIGLVVGILLEWYVVRLLMLDEAGWVFPLVVPLVPCAVVVGGSIVLATLVGLWPAHHATQLRITEAIAYE